MYGDAVLILIFKPAVRSLMRSRTRFSGTRYIVLLPIQLHLSRAIILQLEDVSEECLRRGIQKWSSIRRKGFKESEHNQIMLFFMHDSLIHHARHYANE